MTGFPFTRISSPLTPAQQNILRAKTAIMRAKSTFEHSLAMEMLADCRQEAYFYAQQKAS